MLKRTFMGVMLGAFLAVGAFAADVVVRIAPPRVRVEHRPHAPGRDYVWVSGYQRWDGRGYVWEPGRWERPPRAHARWEAHHWVKRDGGWVLVEGHWR
jgi:hypothetical protein